MNDLASINAMIEKTILGLDKNAPSEVTKSVVQLKKFRMLLQYIEKVPLPEVTEAPKQYSEDKKFYNGVSKNEDKLAKIYSQLKEEKNEFTRAKK